jgi:hypothetical protein
MAQETATEQGKKYKLNYDAKAAPHNFKIGQKIFLNDSTSLGKNSKLSPNWTGPYEIVDLNDNNAKIKIKNKLKVVNIARIKPFIEEPTKRPSQDDSSPSQDSPNGLDQGQLQGFPKRPMTRAFQKLQDLKNAATLAIAILEEEQECDGNPFSDNFDKYHCRNCYSGIKSFLRLPNIKQIFKSASKTFPDDNLIDKNLCACQKSKVDQENLINFNNDVDPRPLATIKEELRRPLLSVASKLLSEQHLSLNQLSKEEQDLWNTYDNRDIYEFLTGEKDTHPEFRFDWIVTDPKIRLPNNWQNFLLPQPEAQPQPAQPPPAPVPDQIPLQQPLQPQLQTAILVAPQHTRFLRNKQPVDYKELHTGLKRKCKTLRRKATPVVTKLAPGAFSPRRDNDGNGPSTSTSAPLQ